MTTIITKKRKFLQKDDLKTANTNRALSYMAYLSAEEGVVLQNLIVDSLEKNHGDDKTKNKQSKS